MIVDLYSKRIKREQGATDVYQYDSFSGKFRTQICYLWERAIGDPDNETGARELIELIVFHLREEFGVFKLYSDRHAYTSPKTELTQYLLREDDPERILDVIDFSFRVIDRMWRRPHATSGKKSNSHIDGILKDLNTRFKENSLGYQFENGQLVRMDSDLIHSEVVKPTLRLLNQSHLRGAEDEYLKAHDHYRHGNTKEAMNECLKSFESAMMGICDRRGWTYDKKDNAKRLLEICFTNQLVPDFWQSQMTALRTLLEGSVPTGRNKLAGHGQGADPVDVPGYLASYMMHMTASTLKFLAEADEAMQ